MCTVRTVVLLLCVAATHFGDTLAADAHHGMVLIPTRKTIVGTNVAQREELARRFDCHPTWLGDDLPQHEVQLPAFWIDRFPVTNAQYLAFVEATGHSPPSWWGRWGGVHPVEYADHPVVGISGQDAAAYSAWAGKRLPSAEEWESAIGNPDGAIFAWGEAWPGPLKLRREQRVFWELPGTRPVGSGDCGRSVVGVEDFAGQTLEWVSDYAAVLLVPGRQPGGLAAASLSRPENPDSASRQRISLESAMREGTWSVARRFGVGLRLRRGRPRRRIQ